mmetsp:Transcript_30900/g.71207  ORF Transcript_30900/g.71207 Transcript_30900/m.71207 type:complete len:262 (-) Transcript_30900:1460-2245(-)
MVGGAQLREGLEELRQLIWFHTDPVIGDLEININTLDSPARRLGGRRLDLDKECCQPIRRAKLDSIAQQVGRDLSEARGVTLQEPRQVLVNFEGDSDMLVGGHSEHSHLVNNDAEQVRQVEGHLFKLEFALLHLVEVEHVVDNTVHHPSLRQQQLHVIKGELAVVGQHEVAQSENCRQRISQLVTHVLQKLALGPVACVLLPHLFHLLIEVEGTQHCFPFLRVCLHRRLLLLSMLQLERLELRLFSVFDCLCSVPPFLAQP